MRRYTSSQDAAPNGHAFHNQNGMGEAWRTRPHVETVGSEVRGSGPPLFALMLGAFAMVIVLGVGGMFMMVGITIGHEMATLRSQYANMPSPMASPFGAAGGWTWSNSPENTVATFVPDIARGVASGGLLLCAVLLGVAAFFSRRLARPISRLTLAAQQLASGDLSARVVGGRVRVREINELSNAFNSMAGSIAAADEQRRQLTADVAHELRTPLSIIKGRLEGMQDGVYEPNPEQVKLLLAETSLLERMIEDLRILAQADAGQLPLYLEQVLPGDLLAATVRAFAPQAHAAGVALYTKQTGPLPELSVDPQRLSQVLGNLVSNALRYTTSGGSITVSAGMVDEGKNISFAVSDTGTGIDPAQLPYIFDRFWKADKARSRAGGAGLGLAIARRIVEAHGGRVWASSQLGQGTTVGFVLPVPVAALEPAVR